MEGREFVGNGWERKYGVSIKVKKAQIASLPENKYGEVALYVGKLKNPNSKSKATHYVAVEEERQADVRDDAPQKLPDF